ncbi:N-acetylmuramidase family protein [Paracoccus beibuensis]|uniref:N-acetylmuramidase family protein n=1 Tax=Paracoccus beibuensis TaxID=547602 RepID=UPI0022405499|nr:N-acetylmuramidase family protein [Paracoccus beibuensis]
MSEWLFKGRAKRLDDIDLPRIASRIGVGEDELHAVLEVETRGGGFDSQGRPKMLFEPHIFWRELGAGAKRDRAAREGLACRKWGEIKYPRDSYPRLIAAMRIDENAALRSASWGLGQIMGFNCRPAGYGSAAAMVRDFLDDEERHLEAMVEFLISEGLDDELRRHDWSGFARGYNGAGYAAHGYHTKLAAAFKKWQGIKDTPFVIPRDCHSGIFEAIHELADRAGFSRG